jgi:hypothetical protein
MQVRPCSCSPPVHSYPFKQQHSADTENEETIIDIIPYQQEVRFDSDSFRFDYFPDFS